MLPSISFRRRPHIFSEDKMFKEEFFKNWNYKKHAMFCTAVYLGLYAFDMTISYFIVKKLLNKQDA